MRLIEIFENQEAEAEPQYKREMTHEQFIQFMNNSGGIYDWMIDLQHPPIWRGDREEFEAADINPRVKGRKSRNTTNYYTVFTSNHPSWSQFPPRNASMISATNSTLASGYGNGKAYVVLLPKNARIGVCPEDDFWNSFPVIADNVPDTKGPQVLNSFMMSISDYTDYYQINITNYEDLVDFFGQLDMVLAHKTINDFDIPRWYVDTFRDTFRWFQSQHDAGKSFMEIYATLMDPQSNGFRITTANDPALAKNQYQEVWFDSDCVMVNYWSWQEYQKIRTQQDMQS